MFEDDAPEPYQVPSVHHGLTNWVVPISGTCVTAYIGQWDHSKDEWSVSLWQSSDGVQVDDECIHSDTYSFPGGEITVTAEQVARVAFLLGVEYKEGE